MRTFKSSLPGRIALTAVLLTSLSVSTVLADGVPPPDPPPPPPPAPPIYSDSLLFIRHITIGKPACETCPGRVCPGDPVDVTVSGVIPAGCVQFRGLHLQPVAGPITVVSADFVVDTCRAVCPALLAPFSGSLSLPAEAIGRHTLSLQEDVRACPDTSAIARVAARTLAYEVVPDCGAPPPPDSLARTLTVLRIVPELPCNGDSVTLQLLKNGCPPCVNLTGLSLTRVRGIVGSLDWRPSCLELVCRPETLSLALGRFAAGSHVIRVATDVHVLGTDKPDSTISFDRAVAFEVRPDCAVEPPPLDSLVRTLTTLRIVPELRCAGDSLTLQLLTNGCPPCVHLTGLGSDAARGFLASVEWQPRCVNIACRPETLSFGLGRFAAGSFSLNVLTDVHVLREAGADTTITYRTDLMFEVPVNCDTLAPPCLNAFLPPRQTSPACDLHVRPGARVAVLLPALNGLRSGGIAGVEGTVSNWGPTRILNVEYAGAASGVHLSWVSHVTYVSFVLFGTTPDVVPSGVHDLLRVTVAVDSNSNRQVGVIVGHIDLASGPNGEAVPICPEEPNHVTAGVRLCVDSSAPGCDVNGDGHADVRDLVLMARCLRQTVSDSSGNAACYDCDGDGTFGIPDLFCCAREILHGPGISHDSTHVQPGLSVSMDPPVRDGDAVRVLLHVRGAGALGVALLRVRYPADRWRLVPLETADPAIPAGWLPLTDAGEAGLLRVGALRLADVAADELVYEVRVVPIAGAEQSGTLSVEGADLSAPDGAMLAPPGALPSVSLSATAPVTVLELAPPRPNPFTHSATFTIGLPADADVDLTVHDLAGRRVTTLAHGRLGAGRRDFTWDGAGARDGVYFVRLTVDGRVLSTRVALLKGGR